MGWGITGFCSGEGGRVQEKEQKSGQPLLAQAQTWHDTTSTPSVGPGKYLGQARFGVGSGGVDAPCRTVTVQRDIIVAVFGNSLRRQKSQPQADQNGHVSYSIILLSIFLSFHPRLNTHHPWNGILIGKMQFM